MFTGSAKPLCHKKERKCSDRYTGVDLTTKLTAPVRTALLPELQVPTMVVALCILSYTMGVLPWAIVMLNSDASTTGRRGERNMAEKHRIDDSVEGLWEYSGKFFRIHWNRKVATEGRRTMTVIKVGVQRVEFFCLSLFGFALGSQSRGFLSDNNYLWT